MKAGDLIAHANGEEFVVAENQNPIPGLDWIHGEETIYAINGHGQRIPLHKETVQLVEAA